MTRKAGVKRGRAASGARGRSRKKPQKAKKRKKQSDHEDYGLPANFVDEEISEDNAFNSEDERLYGGVLREIEARTNGWKDNAGGGEDYDEPASDEEGDGMDLSSMLDNSNAAMKRVVSSFKNTSGTNSEQKSLPSGGALDAEAKMDQQEEADDEDLLRFVREAAGETKETASVTAPTPKVRRRGQEAVGRTDDFGGISKGGGQDGTLGLADLLSSLERDSGEGAGLTDRAAVSTLKKQLLAVPSGGGSEAEAVAQSVKLAGRMDAYHRAKMERTVAYEQQKELMTDKWEPIVRNVQQIAKQGPLSFPLQRPQRHKTSIKELSAKFTASGDLESDLGSILSQFGLTEDTIQQTEEGMLRSKALTPEEMQARRAKMRKMRDVLFYNELKAKRIAKIKSRTFRKIHKKKMDRARAAAGGVDVANMEIEELYAMDPERAQQEMERRQMARIKERMSLTHKGMSRWSQTQKKRQAHHHAAGRTGAEVKSMREKLQAQYQIGEKLRASVFGQAALQAAQEDESGRRMRALESQLDHLVDQYGEESVVAAAHSSQGGSNAGASPTDNPADRERRDEIQRILKELEASVLEDSEAQKSSSLMNLKFMRRAQERKRQEALAELQAMDKAENPLFDTGDALGDDAVGSSSDEDSSSSEDEDQPAQPGQNGMVLESVALGGTVASDVLVSSGGNVALDGVRAAVQTPAQQPAQTASSDSQSKQTQKSSGDSDSDSDSDSDTADDEEMIRTMQRNNAWKSGGGGRPSVVSTTTTTSNEGALRGMLSSTHNVLLGEPTDAGEQKRKPAQPSSSARPAISEAGGHTKEDAPSTQRPAASAKQTNEKVSQEELVKMAFALGGEDEEALFLADKEAAVAANLPQADGPVSLPGWGCWGGVGLKPRKSRKQKARERSIKAALAAKREKVLAARLDRGRDHVWINHHKDKKVSKYLVPKLPFPYTSVAAYERDMRKAVGEEWNLHSEVEKATRPEVICQAGAYIQPMHYKASLATHDQQNRPTQQSQSGDRKKKGQKGQKRKRKKGRA